MNKAILIGRVGKDPELKYTPAGHAVCNFSLATSERFKDESGEKQEKTTWHFVKVWGKQAEVIKEYVKKGHRLSVVGKIDNRSYDDKDGNKRYISEVVVNEFELLQSRSEGAADVPEGEPAGSADDQDLPF